VLDVSKILRFKNEDGTVNQFSSLRLDSLSFFSESSTLIYC
jgi:hypothetical protein